MKILTLRVPKWQELNESIVPLVYSYMQEDSGRKVSNHGGWQSHQSVTTNTIFNECFDQLKQCASEKIKINVNDLQFRFWINVNWKGCFNDWHDHRSKRSSGTPSETFMSGIYYVRVPDKSGNLHFKKLEIVPQDGDMYLFSPYEKHRVGMNCSDEERISIAFNIKRVYNN